MNALHFKLREDRHCLAMDGAVVRDDGREHAVEVHDLALRGCSVSGDFLIGEIVTVRLPGVGDLMGRVRWSVLGRAGIRFEKRA